MLPSLEGIVVRPAERPAAVAREERHRSRRSWSVTTRSTWPSKMAATMDGDPGAGRRQVRRVDRGGEGAVPLAQVDAVRGGVVGDVVAVEVADGDRIVTEGRAGQRCERVGGERRPGRQGRERPDPRQALDLQEVGPRDDVLVDQGPRVDGRAAVALDEQVPRRVEQWRSRGGGPRGLDGRDQQGIRAAVDPEGALRSPGAIEMPATSAAIGRAPARSAGVATSGPVDRRVRPSSRSTDQRRRGRCRRLRGAVRFPGAGRRFIVGRPFGCVAERGDFVARSSGRRRDRLEALLDERVAEDGLEHRVATDRVGPEGGAGLGRLPLQGLPEQGHGSGLEVDRFEGARRPRRARLVVGEGRGPGEDLGRIVVVLAGRAGQPERLQRVGDGLPVSTEADPAPARGDGAVAVGGRTRPGR